MADPIVTSIPGEPCEWCKAPTNMRTVTPVDAQGNHLHPVTFRVFTCTAEHADASGRAKLGDKDTRRQEAIRLGQVSAWGGAVTPTNWGRMTRDRIDWTTPDMQTHRQMLCWYFDTLPDRHKAGDGLYLWGRRGNGKSMLAAVVLTEAEKLGIAGRFETAAELVGQWLRADDPAAYRKHVCRVPFLVIDELGIETPSSVSVEALFSVIDQRYSHNRPTIITTNLTAQDLAERYADIDREAMARLLDRIIERAPVLEFKGEGFRRQKRPNYYALARQHAEAVKAAANDDDIPDWEAGA